MDTRFKSPLRYPGGKNCIYTFMKSFLEENDLTGIDYAEPYGGGAGLALRLLMDNLVSTIHINDLDISIYAFWYVILHQPDQFCTWIENVDVTIRNWDYYKKIQNEREQADLLDIAKSTFFLNRTNVSGVLSGGPIGGHLQKGTYKLNVRFNKKNLIQRIQKITEYSDKIHLSNLDGVEFIHEKEANNNEYFIYLDPPYYKKGAALYLNAFDDEAHRNLAVNIGLLHNHWLVSYDNQSFIRDLYPTNRKILYQLSQCASNRIGDEILIFDSRLTFDKSLHNLNFPQEI